MQITVKSTRVIKEGFQKKDSSKPFTWWSVVADDGSEKGTEYTTFDNGIKKLGPGSVIEIGEMGEKGNITIVEGKPKFKAIINVIIDIPATAPIAPEASAPGVNGSDMSKDDWAEKQRIERGSIEAQTSFKGIAAIAQAYVAAGIEPQGVAEFKEYYLLALAWAKGRMLNNGIPGADLSGLPVPRLVDPVRATPITPEEEKDLLFPDFKDIGELFTACKKIDISRSEALKRIGAREGDNLAKINLKDAWAVITANGATA